MHRFGKRTKIPALLSVAAANWRDPTRPVQFGLPGRRGVEISLVSELFQ
jgi:hypothetical protein